MTYPTVRIAAKKLASEELTACKEPANEESMVSISWRIGVKGSASSCGGRFSVIPCQIDSTSVLEALYHEI
jgi:hypothetical protein